MFSPAASSLRDAFGVPPTKVPASTSTFASYAIPPVACYIVAAVLAVTPQTRAFRVALWPVLALLAFRAVVSMDMSHGDPDRIILNVNLVLFMLTATLHALSWALAKKPLVRHLRPANNSSSTFMDALDLASNLRGCGWDWSRGLHVPRETRPTHRIAFAFYALLSGVAHFLVDSALHQAIQTFTTSTGAERPTIFDDTLPVHVRYLRAGIIATLTGFATQCGVQMGYDLCTALGVLVLGHHPAQWPPAFDNPWYATSLADFWGRRWHQFFRHVFLVGARPCAAVFGRVGGIVGAFVMSGVCHHIMMIASDGRSEMWRMLVGFGMMALGVLIERASYQATGRKVGGLVGWVWTMTWLLVWGSVTVDGFVRSSMFMPKSGVYSLVPVRMLIDNLVIDFDAWLHTI